ncbi:MAG: hypothetical protein ACI4J6_08960 [Oscillospiraceae bacterium]
MKMKKILAALAASTMAVAMLGLTVSAAGEEAESDTIGEVTDEPEDVVEEPEDVVDEPEEEVVDEPEEEVVDEPSDEPADVPAENPGTGNSPIALAVIPVALAAAAVVAKKVK